MDEIRYKPIGVIHSPFREPKGTPIQPAGAEGVDGTIEVFPEYAEGLKDVEGFSHIILVYHFHLSERSPLEVKPYMDNEAHGVFAMRGPSRPNPIGISTVRLVGIEGNVLHIQDVDIVDGTPLLDIKPYVPEFDVREVEKIGWLERKVHKLPASKDDGRFARRLQMVKRDHRSNLTQVLQQHSNVLRNPSRRSMIQAAVDNKEAIVSANGALATWTPPESTGRSPKDTYIVCRPESEGNIDWDSPNNIPMAPETFDMVFEDALTTLSGKAKVYVTDKVVGADTSYALPVQTVSDQALTALFTDNMFRPVPDDIGRSTFAQRGFTLLVVPYDKLDRARYEGRLRKLPDGRTSDMAVAMDFDRHLGVVYGSAYGGSVKKLIFTVMNYILPGEGLLPLHCSANEGPEGDSALLLGLSGTGKTTLSADPRRALLGDDEHGWSDNGIANFENGCYAKLINLRADKEPEIWNAVLHEAHYLDHGAIVENAMMYPNGTFDLDDERLTPNSRASYPLTFLTNIKPSSKSGHPRTILFLTADANGVLPPISWLTPEQAMLWFLMGYTSKLAGTETGIVDPVSTFSRFFGEPFMPRNPDVYAQMLGERMQRHGTRVYLVNTGWSGGPYGVGERMDINLTREIVNAALSGQLKDVEYVEDTTFHILVPKQCPGVPPEVLFPRNTWADKEAYDARARKLADDFSAHFDKAYGNKNIAPAVARQCPGK